MIPPEVTPEPDWNEPDDEDPGEPTPLDTPEQAVMNGAMPLVAQVYSQACDVCGRPTYGNHEGQHLADAVVCEDCCRRLESRKNK